MWDVRVGKDHSQEFADCSYLLLDTTARASFPLNSWQRMAREPRSLRLWPRVNPSMLNDG